MSLGTNTSRAKFLLSISVIHRAYEGMAFVRINANTVGCNDGPNKGIVAHLPIGQDRRLRFRGTKVHGCLTKLESSTIPVAHTCARR
jgi:hypothetical protein